MRAVTSSGKGNDEISGQPAVAFDLTFNNAGNTAVSLSGVVVQFTDAAGNPGSADNGDLAHDVATPVASHASQTGTYVFRVPTNARSTWKITVDYTDSATLATTEVSFDSTVS